MPDELWRATTTPDVVRVPARTVLAIDGAGPPEEGGGFERSIGALYGAAYGLLFARKRTEHGTQFRIGPLEARWWAEGASESLVTAPRATWRWCLRMGVPDDVAKEELAAVVHAAITKKGGKLEGSREAKSVRLERLPAARFGRALHIGPYAEEPRTFAVIREVLAASGVVPDRSHLEIYLSDPRRTAPERLKTVLLLETKKR